MKPMELFKTEDSVEVASKQEGFFGSYYEATVMAKIKSRNEYIVEYKTLVEDENPEITLQESILFNEVRPVPPEFSFIKFKDGDSVNAFDNDGWWSGRIKGKTNEQGKFYVWFDYFMIGIYYDVIRLRIHQEWHKGKWYYLPTRD